MDEILPQPQPGPGPKPRILNWKILISILVFCLAAVAVYALIVSRGSKKPALPSVAVNPYPAGTQLQASSTAPSDFPSDVLREQYAIEKATTVTYPDGKTNITVAYLSENNIFNLLSLYTKYFQESYWKMQSSQLLQNSGVVVAKNEVGEIAVTMAPVKSGSGSKVTFSYTYSK